MLFGKEESICPAFNIFPICHHLAQVFTYQWSVNFQFLPEDIFVLPQLALALLFLHLRMLRWLADKHW